MTRVRKYLPIGIASAIAFVATVSIIAATSGPSEPSEPSEGLPVNAHFLGRTYTAESLADRAETIVVAERGDSLGRVNVGKELDGSPLDPSDPGLELVVYEFEVIEARKGAPAVTILVGNPSGTLDLGDGSKVKLLFLTGDTFPGVLDGEIVYQPVMMEQGTFDQSEHGFTQVAGRIVADANGVLRDLP